MTTLMKRNRSFLPELPSLFEDFMNRDLFSGLTGNENGSLPAVNIRETDSTYELEVAAPGMKKDDFKVELDNNMLVISAEQENKQEEKDKEGNYTRREFHYQNFMRSFSLPEKMVNGDNISARYSDGVLHISVPKTEEAKLKPARKIEIE